MHFDLDTQLEHDDHMNNTERQKYIFHKIANPFRAKLYYLISRAAFTVP